MNKIITALFLCCIVTLAMTACTGTTTSSGSPGAPGSGSQAATEVHMNGQQFVQPSVTVHKGSTLTFIDDAPVVHVIQNGSWENGTAKTSKEPGALAVNVQLNGNDQKTIGPFSTAGTYHLYCIVHPGMNLTIIVQ